MEVAPESASKDMVEEFRPKVFTSMEVKVRNMLMVQALSVSGRNSGSLWKRQPVSAPVGVFGRIKNVMSWGRAWCGDEGEKPAVYNL